MAKPRQEKQRALVGAATRIQMNDRAAVKKQVSRREEWQNDAWDMFDLVPEVKALSWKLGDLLAKLRLFPAVDNPTDPDGDPIPVTDPTSGIAPEIAQRAVDELARLGTGAGGHSEILRQLNMNLEIAAEGYLIGQSAREAVIDERTGKEKEPAQPERWRVKSIREVDVKDRKLPDGRKSTITVKDDPDDKKGEPLDPEQDTAIRFWQRHPAFEKRADCNMRGCLDDCETLLTLKMQLRAESKSHIPAGFLFASNDLTWAMLNPATPDEEGDESEPEQHPLMKQMSDVMTAVIEDPSHVASLAPMLGLIPVGPNEDIRQKVMHLSMARTTSDTLDARIHARVETIARGLNAPPEKAMGHQKTTFANAKQIDQDLYKEHLDPRALLIVDILTLGFLRPQLLEGDNPADVAADNDLEPGQPAPPPPPELVPVDEDTADRIFVWFDPSAMIAKPDVEANADAAHEKGTISDATYRRVKGYSEDDKPTVIELLTRLAFRAGTTDPAVIVALLELLGEPIDVEPLPGSQATPFARIRKALEARSREGVVAAARRRATTRDLVEIDRDLRSRLLVLADRTMTGALNRAGAVLRSKSDARAKALIKDQPNMLVAATLGRALTAATADVDAIFADAFDTMESSFMSWGTTAQAQAIEVASRIASGFTHSQRDALQLRQASDLTEAWGWLKDTLTSLAHAKMFDPTSAAAQVGEFDANLSIQAGVIRQAITRAGGLAGVHTGGQGDAWLSLTDGGSRPAGGIGTGELIMGALAEQGAPIESYVWDYGPGARTTPFEPHLDLDGVEFSNFDDPVLANDDSFPLTAFYMPGDHDGCLCDFVPFVATPDAPDDESGNVIGGERDTGD